jgi:hypothetical protein
MFARPHVSSICKRPAVIRLLRQPQSHCLHASSPLSLPRRKDFFSSNAFLTQKQSEVSDATEKATLESQKQRRRGGRSPAAPASLRRVAVEAQRSKDNFRSKARLREDGILQTKVRPFVEVQGLRSLTFQTQGSYCLRSSRTIQHPQSPRYSARKRL